MQPDVEQTSSGTSRRCTAERGPRDALNVAIKSSLLSLRSESTWETRIFTVTRARNVSASFVGELYSNDMQTFMRNKRNSSARIVPTQQVIRAILDVTCASIWEQNWSILEKMAIRKAKMINHRHRCLSPHRYHYRHHHRIRPEIWRTL